MTTLPQADWTTREDLAQLVAALGMENIRWVGGAVRDTLLGEPVRDVDAATPLLPDEVMARLESGHIRTVPTGIEHGTITAILPDGPVEITTLRRDVSTDGRHADVSFASDWREDAARRDFTINALYAHAETLEISDWFGGLDDLAARRVRFIGDARQRIREDHLRILRYFRFQARFGAELNAEAEEACAELAATMKGLSRERVASELLALLALRDPSATIARMEKLGVLRVILPETSVSELAVLKLLLETESAEKISPDPVRRLAALVPAMPEISASVAVRLRLSKAQRARLVCAAKREPSDVQNPRALAYRTTIECARDRVLLQGESSAALNDWNVPQLPLKGGEIVARGVDTGPQVARILRAVESRWVSEGFPSRERVQELLDNELARG